MRAPDGRDYWVRGKFQELVPPQRVVIVCTADDEIGVPRLEEVIDVTLAERGGKTELKLLAPASGASREAAAMLEGMPKGWAQTIHRLDGHLNPDS